MFTKNYFIIIYEKLIVDIILILIWQLTKSKKKKTKVAWTPTKIDKWPKVGLTANWPCGSNLAKKKIYTQFRIEVSLLFWPHVRGLWIGLGVFILFISKQDFPQLKSDTFN